MRRLIAFFLVVTLVTATVFAQAPVAAPASPPATAPAPPAAGLNDNDFVAICGDSITEQKLYSVYIENYLIMCRPRANLHAAQFGWGGETAAGFLGRMSNVLRFPVTVATTCYGMNDGGYGPLTDEVAKKYREGTAAIVDTFKKSGVRFIVVGSPGVVDSRYYRAEPNADEDKIYNATLASLRDIAREVAKEQGVAFADVHGIMADAMVKAKAKYGADYPVGGTDGVHPLPNGHVVMAYAFLKAMGIDGHIGTITVDLAADTATATDGHKVLASKAGAVEIESSRYPYCFFGDHKDPNSTAGIIEFIPFNHDLNRYQLVVVNAGAGAEKLKVTWGATTKEYAAAELAKGINLAAEFPINPFSEPFQKVEAAVKAQQNFETFLIKDLLHNWPRYLKEVPEQKEALDQVAQGGIDKANALNAASVAAVVPVKHTIKIERIAAAAPAAPAAPAPPAPAPAPAAPAPAVTAPATPASATTPAK